MITLKCQCGADFKASQYAVDHGRKYCSDGCARQFRYKHREDSRLAKVTITLTDAERAAFEHRALNEDTSLVELGRRYILAGLASPYGRQPNSC